MASSSPAPPPRSESSRRSRLRLRQAGWYAAPRGARAGRALPDLRHRHPGGVVAGRVRREGLPALPGVAALGRVPHRLQPGRLRARHDGEPGDDPAHHLRTGRHLDHGGLRVRVPAVPVPPPGVRALHGHADAPDRGHPHPQPPDGARLGLVQLLPGPRGTVHGRRARHLPDPPGLHGRAVGAARRRPPRRLRALPVPHPRGRAARPSRHRRVHGHLASWPRGTSTCGRSPPPPRRAGRRPRSAWRPSGRRTPRP